MNLAVNLLLKKNNKESKNLNTIYDINGNNILCLDDLYGTKYYETLLFLKENKIDTAKENIIKTLDLFISTYNKSTKQLHQYDTINQQIKKLTKNRFLQLGMESFGFIYMAYQIYLSLAKTYTNTKLKYLPVIFIVGYIIYNIYKTLQIDLLKKEINDINMLRDKLLIDNKNIVLQINDMNKFINSTSLYQDMLKYLTKDILGNLNNLQKEQIKESNTENNIDQNAGIDIEKLIEVEKKVVPELFPEGEKIIELEELEEFEKKSELKEDSITEEIINEIKEEIIEEQIIDDIHKELELEEKEKEKEKEIEENKEKIKEEKPKRKGRKSTEKKQVNKKVPVNKKNNKKNK